MAEGDVHTEPRQGGWANKIEGNQRVSSTHETKIAAQKRGRDIAIVRKVEHFIHDRGGRIIERNSYGNDPPQRRR
jgi:hypothetical protein